MFEILFRRKILCLNEFRRWWEVPGRGDPSRLEGGTLLEMCLD